MTENKLPVKEKVNNNNDLMPTEQESSEVVETKPLGREDRFIRNYLITDNIPESALDAGYSENYAKTGAYLKFNSERFLKKLRDCNNQEYHKLLPKLHKIDKKALEYVDGDISRLPKFERTIGTIKRQIGVLQDETTGSINYVNIESIQAIISNMHNKKMADKE